MTCIFTLIARFILVILHADQMNDTYSFSQLG